jgi:hypothetical protein
MQILASDKIPLRFDEETKNVQMMSDISRINRYGTQSHCIDTTNVNLHVSHIQQEDY